MKPSPEPAPRYTMKSPASTGRSCQEARRVPGRPSPGVPTAALVPAFPPVAAPLAGLWGVPDAPRTACPRRPPQLRFRRLQAQVRTSQKASRRLCLKTRSVRVHRVRAPNVGRRHAAGALSEVGDHPPPRIRAPRAA